LRKTKCRDQNYTFCKIGGPKLHLNVYSLNFPWASKWIGTTFNIYSSVPPSLKSWMLSVVSDSVIKITSRLANSDEFACFPCVSERNRKKNRWWSGSSRRLGESWEQRAFRFWIRVGEKEKALERTVLFFN
jgi:hypothetical protein